MLRQIFNRISLRFSQFFSRHLIQCFKRNVCTGDLIFDAAPVTMCLVFTGDVNNGRIRLGVSCLTSLREKHFLSIEKVYSLGLKKKEEIRSPLSVEFGNPMDQNIHSCYYRIWPGDISRKAQETQN